MARRNGKKAAGLGRLSILDIANELHSRRSELPQLHARRDELAAQLAEIDTTIAALSRSNGSGSGGASRSGGGRVSGRRSGRVRPKNESNLVESLAALLNGKTMSVTDIAAEVQKAGYKTNSPNFRTIVNQALISSGRFKRVGRGQYIAK